MGSGDAIRAGNWSKPGDVGDYIQTEGKRSSLTGD